MKTILLSSLLISGAGLLHADIIYSNLGAPFNPNSGLAVVAGGTDFSTAMQFQVTYSYVVQEIDFVAQLISGSDTAIDATIYADNGGVPGTEIFTTGYVNNLLSGTAAEIEEPIAGGPTLVTGGTYWLSLDGDTSDTIRWNYNGAGASGLAASYTSGWTASSRELGAFEIDGTLIPEPATFLLIAPAIGALFLRRRMRRKN